MTEASLPAFVDTETTGLDADRHQIWEVALIVDDDEHHWCLPVDLGRADPAALRISGFHDRQCVYGDLACKIDKSHTHVPVSGFATRFAGLTRGRHLVGAVVSFDEERLRKLLRANGACPEWHYHLIDVEGLAVGYLAGVHDALVRYGRASSPDGVHHPPMVSLPWKSEDISRALGVDPAQFDRHTALGDARWAKAIYEAVTSRKHSDNGAA